MKKEYMKPAMAVVVLQQKCQILAESSGYVNNITENSDGISWKDGGFTDGEDDY